MIVFPSRIAVRLLMCPSEVDEQRAYYARTAANYDQDHVCEDKVHALALRLLDGFLDHYGIHSLLDVGSGTGRVPLYYSQRKPALKVVGVEPVAEMRAVGHASGLSEEQLLAGDATQLQFPDGCFDVVCAFGVLHHVPNPAKAIAEMLRVARRGLFISDSNNFGQGPPRSRLVKQAMNLFHLWPLANLAKTRGKGYSWSEGDGVYYSYSVFNNYAQVKASCPTVHLVNTEGTGVNPYRTAGHVALFGLKK